MPLSSLDTIVLVLGFLAAASLYGIRLIKKKRSAPGQFLMDWLGTWTIIELVFIGIASLNHDLIGHFGISLPDPTDIIKNNGLLLPISMMYCAGLVGKNTILSTLEALGEPAKDSSSLKESGK